MSKPNYNCEYIKDVLPAFYEGLLGSKESSIIEEHIQSCRECAEAIERLKEISNKIISFQQLNESYILEDNMDIDSLLNKLDEENFIGYEEISALVDSELDECNYHHTIDEVRNNEDNRAKLHEIYRMKEMIQSCKNAIEADIISSSNSIRTETCNNVIQNLSAYIDSELNNEESKELAAHILQCKECRNEYDLIKKVQLLTQEALLEPAKNIELWPSIEKKLFKKDAMPLYAFTTVASFAVVIFTWNFLINTFPIEMDTKPIAYSQNSSKNLINYSRDKTIADNRITSDAYMFSNVYDTPPSGVIPIIYNYNGLNKDNYKKYDY